MYTMIPDLLKTEKLCLVHVCIIQGKNGRKDHMLLTAITRGEYKCEWKRPGKEEGVTLYTLILLHMHQAYITWIRIFKLPIQI